MKTYFIRVAGLSIVQFGPYRTRKIAEHHRRELLRGSMAGQDLEVVPTRARKAVKP